jgi:hypothetical protein
MFKNLLSVCCVPDSAAVNGTLKLHSRCSNTHVQVPSICNCHDKEDGVLPAGVRKLHLGACRAHLWHFVRKERQCNMRVQYQAVGHLQFC